MHLPSRTLAWVIALALIALAAIAAAFALQSDSDPVALNPSAQDRPDPGSKPSSATTVGKFKNGPKARAKVWALGDSADGGAGSREVAELIRADRPDRFIYLGDVYEDGTRAEFNQNYQSVFGPLKRATLPTPGNHEWPNHADGYDPYWSAVSGASRPPDFYSVKVGGWQLLSLNSETPHGQGSEQWRWLEEQISGPGNCRIAFWHRPRFSAGSHGDSEDIAPLWDLLPGRARVVLSGHEHNMQRLSPIDGITTLIAGAGGHSDYRFNAKDERLAFGKSRVDGALRLKLRQGLLEWRFVSVDGEVLDQGRRSCRPG